MMGNMEIQDVKETDLNLMYSAGSREFMITDRGKEFLTELLLLTFQLHQNVQP